MGKICSKCKENKELSEFHKDKYKKDGHRNDCSACNRKNAKQYRKDNAIEVNARNRERYLTDSERQKAYSKEYRASNLQKSRKNTKEWRKVNPEKANLYEREKRNKDLNYKLKCSLRVRINGAIKGNYKSGSAVTDLGCSIEFLKQYLESKFQPGMTWGNWSRNGWHIDHIVPLSSFNLSNREELLKACNYTNLQPLWASDNIKKGNRI